MVKITTSNGVLTPGVPGDGGTVEWGICEQQPLGDEHELAPSARSNRWNKTISKEQHRDRCTARGVVDSRRKTITEEIGKCGIRKIQVDRKSNAEQRRYSQKGTSGDWINVSLDTLIKETSSKARSFRPHKNMKQNYIGIQRKGDTSARTGAQLEDSWIHGIKQQRKR